MSAVIRAKIEPVARTGMPNIGSSVVSRSRSTLTTTQRFSPAEMPMLALSTQTILTTFGEEENQLALHRNSMAQCAPLDAQAFGVATQQMIERREEVFGLRAELKAKTGGFLTKEKVAKRRGVTAKTVDRMVEEDVMPAGRLARSRQRWSAAEVEAAVQ